MEYHDYSSSNPSGFTLSDTVKERTHLAFGDFAGVRDKWIADYNSANGAFLTALPSRDGVSDGAGGRRLSVQLEESLAVQAHQKMQIEALETKMEKLS